MPRPRVSHQSTTPPAAKDEAATPAVFVRALEKREGITFDLDPFSDGHNAKAPRFYTEADNGYEQPWGPVPRCPCCGIIPTIRGLANEKLHEMRSKLACHHRALSPESTDEIGSGLALPGVSARAGAGEDACPPRRPRGACQGAGSEAQASILGAGTQVEARSLLDRESPAPTGERSSVRLDTEEVAVVSDVLDGSVRVLRSVRPSDTSGITIPGAGPLYPDHAPELSGDSAVEHGAGLPPLQQTQRQASPGGLDARPGSPCPYCGVLTESAATNVWVNCPYSGNHIIRACAKAHIEQWHCTSYLLLPANTGTAWYATFAPLARRVIFIQGRVQFSSPFYAEKRNDTDSLLLVFHRWYEPVRADFWSPSAAERGGKPEPLARKIARESRKWGKPA